MIVTRCNWMPQLSEKTHATLFLKYSNVDLIYALPRTQALNLLTRINRAVRNQLI